MSARLAALLLALLWLGRAAPGRAEEVFFSDARMSEASALLGDKEQYPHVVALYRDVLREFPSNGMARLWLARVLSWQGLHDESLAEYDLLLALDPPAADLDIERAEVLSWAGRYDEALASFDAILLERPDSQRALVGRARAERWSGRQAEAANSYRQALALGEDAEVRGELDALRSTLGKSGQARGRHAFDSDGFERTSILSTARVDLDFRTRALAEMTFGRVGRESSARLQAIGAPLSTDGVSGLVGLERQLSPEVVASASVGYAWWNAAPGSAMARASVVATLPSQTSISFQLDYGSFLEWSDSYDALNAGLDGTNLRGTVWQALGERTSVFGYTQTTFVSDGNERFGVGGSLEFVLVPHFELTVGLAGDFVTYTGRSDLYYDPSLDIGVSVFGRGGLPLFGGARLFGELSTGGGHAVEGPASGSGLTYGVLGGLEVSRGDFVLELSGGRSQSQRSTEYTLYHAGASLAMRF